LKEGIYKGVEFNLIKYYYFWPSFFWVGLWKRSQGCREETIQDTEENLEI
jgi:hypothetical protein